MLEFKLWECGVLSLFVSFQNLEENVEEVIMFTTNVRRKDPAAITNFLLLVFFLALHQAIAEPSSPPEESLTQASDVIQLTSRNFARLVSKSKQTTLVLLYRPKDSRSDYLSPIIDALATHMKGIIQVGKANCEKQKELCQYHRVSEKQLPLLLMYRSEPTTDPLGIGYLGEGPWSGKDPISYDLPTYEPEKVADWALSFLHTRNILRVTFRNLEEFHRIKELPKLFYFADTNNKPDSLMKALSMTFERRMLFGLVKYDEIKVQKKFGIEQYPTLMILDTQWRMHHYGGKPGAAAIIKWVTKHALKEPLETFDDPFTVKYKFKDEL